jgi:S-disulfanyl-L-cysteine oxidoreductase SoxD
MHLFLKALVLTAVLTLSIVSDTVQAQTPTYPNIGRAPTQKEVRDWDIIISPDGKELPPGSGTAKEGTWVFVARGCSQCHGPNGAEGPAPRLVADEKTREGGMREQPYATIVWDFINRGMPMRQEGLLTPNEVYAVTAFLLYRNGIIREDEVMDAKSLPKVQMPHRDKAPVPDAPHEHPPVGGNARP